MALVLVRARRATVTTDPIIAVAAHRRAVLGQRDDGERWAALADRATRKATPHPPLSPLDVNASEVLDLLDALADETIARRQAEAARDALRQSHDDCDRTYADMTDALERLGAEREGLPEWRCPGCGAVTRARMADHEKS